MRKLLVLIIILLITSTLIGCNKGEPQKSTDQSDSEVVIKMPTDNTVNGYLKHPAPSEDKAVYIANKNSKKFHKPDCQYAVNISEEYSLASSTREFLTENGYSPCKKCNP